MNSYDFFIYEFIWFMDSYMNSGVPRFQISEFTSYKKTSFSSLGPVQVASRSLSQALAWLPEHSLLISACQ